MTNGSWTEFLKHVDFAIKNNENYTNQDFGNLIEKVQNVLDAIPEVLPNGLFTQDRKLKLLGKLNKLQLLLVDREARAR